MLARATAVCMMRTCLTAQFPAISMLHVLNTTIYFHIIIRAWRRMMQQHTRMLDASGAARRSNCMRHSLDTLMYIFANFRHVRSDGMIPACRACCTSLTASSVVLHVFNITCGRATQGKPSRIECKKAWHDQSCEPLIAANWQGLVHGHDCGHGHGYVTVTVTVTVMIMLSWLD
jgi:hypothetical protein